MKNPYVRGFISFKYCAYDYPKGKDILKHILLQQHYSYGSGSGKKGTPEHRSEDKKMELSAIVGRHEIIGPQLLCQRRSITEYQQASSACKVGCICKCHAPRHYKIIRQNYLFGSLLVTISAAPKNKSLCSETSCSRRMMSVARATYRFPSWFLARILYLTISTPYGGMDACLKSIRVVPDNADIMRFAKAGDIDGVKSMIQKGLASPLDVNATWNVPVLSVGKDMPCKHSCSVTNQQ